MPNLVPDSLRSPLTCDHDGRARTHYSPAATVAYKPLKAHAPTKSLRRVFFSSAVYTFDSRTERMTSLYSCTAGFLSESSSCVPWASDKT